MLIKKGVLKNPKLIEAFQKFERFYKGSRDLNLLRSREPKFFCQDGSSGLPEIAGDIGGFDKIIASAALKLLTSDLPAGEAGVHSLPQAWRDQLKIGGKIVAPIGGSIFEFVKKSETEFSSTEHPGFAFVPLIRDK